MCETDLTLIGHSIAITDTVESMEVRSVEFFYNFDYVLVYFEVGDFSIVITSAILKSCIRIITQDKKIKSRLICFLLAVI